MHRCWPSSRKMDPGKLNVGVPSAEMKFQTTGGDFSAGGAKGRSAVSLERHR